MRKAPSGPSGPSPSRSSRPRPSADALLGQSSQPSQPSQPQAMPAEVGLSFMKLSMRAMHCNAARCIWFLSNKRTYNIV